LSCEIVIPKLNKTLTKARFCTNNNYSIFATNKFQMNINTKFIVSVFTLLLAVLSAKAFNVTFRVDMSQTAPSMDGAAALATQ